MSYKKMRKMLIILLLFSNIFMLLNLFQMKYSDYSSNKQMINNNIEFLSQKGLNLTFDQLNQDISEYNSYKYSTFSQKNIDLLLENAISAENDVYIGDNGTAKINEDGSFSVTLDNSLTQNSISDVLKTAGFDLNNANITQNNNEISYTYKIGNLPVSNCNFTVILNTNTTSIEGTYVFENPVIQPMSASDNIFTVLVDFANSNNKEGTVNSCEIYYQLTENAGATISPVLYLNIDNAEIYYNFLDY